MCLSGRPAPEGRANIGTELSQGAIGMSVVVVRRGGLSAVVVVLVVVRRGGLSAVVVVRRGGPSWWSFGSRSSKSVR